MKQWTVENNMIKTDQMVRFRALGLCRVTGCCSAGVRTAADQCGSSHHSLDITLSHSKHRTVGGGLPAMNDDAISLTYRVGCIAGKPPPTEFAARQRYVEDVVAPPTLDSVSSEAQGFFDEAPRGRMPSRIMLRRLSRTSSKNSGSSSVLPVTASTCVRKSA